MIQSAASGSPSARLASREFDASFEREFRLVSPVVVAQRLTQNQLVRRVVRKGLDRGLGELQRVLRIAGTGRPTRRPDQYQGEDTLPTGKIEFGSLGDDLFEELHHDIEPIGGGGCPLTSLLPHRQRQTVGALGLRRVQPSAPLADLDSLDGEFLSALAPSSVCSMSHAVARAAPR